MATKIMIDIESMALTPDALVLSIGATEFGLTSTGPQFGEERLYVPTIPEQLLLGRRVDQNTQRWWAVVEQAAQHHWLKPEVANTYTPINACIELAHFIKAKAPGEIWANGPQFDIAVLEHLFAQCGVAVPWNYSIIRDLRTIRKVLGEKRELPSLNAADEVAHHPLADNRMQIRSLWQCGIED